ALAYLDAGQSVIPIKRDGSKAPDLPGWKKRQRERMTADEARRLWDRPDPPGIAVICGAVSGGLELIDFDVDADNIFPAWCDLVEVECPGLVGRLSVVRTPRPGYHVRYRVKGGQVPGNDKLASDPRRPAKEQTLIETRGEGGYALAPGSPA